MENKTFSVNRFNREVGKQTKFYNLNKKETANFRAFTLYRCLVYSNNKKGN